MQGSLFLVDSSPEKDSVVPITDREGRAFEGNFSRKELQIIWIITVLTEGLTVVVGVWVSVPASTLEGLIER